VSGLRLGVDLGGTKVEAVILRALPDAPDVVARMRVDTRREAGYEHVVATTAQLVADLVRQTGLDALPPIGVGMPGNVTFRRPDGTRSDVALVKNSNTTCLNGRPFRHDFARALRSRFSAWTGENLTFANDANCFALAEAKYGAARSARVSFGVILGTGVGGGLVFRTEDGVRAWDGAQGIAGEWGHIPIDTAADRPCYCGKRGCVEQFLSGPAIERDYALRSGARRAVPEIAARREEDPHARDVLGGVAEAFGRSIAMVINIVDPDTIVLGGGVSNLDVLYTLGRDAAARWVFNDEMRTAIVKHSLGDSAGVMGAALLV
jgi:fructokinase